MSELHEFLKAAELDLETLGGEEFTVDGRLEVFNGILDTTTRRASYSNSGMAPEDAAQLMFAQSLGYVPKSGDLIGVGGLIWKVSAVRKGKVEYSVDLVSEDE